MSRNDLPDLSPRKGFDKFPRWVVKDSCFPTLDELACKLLVYFSHVRGWTTDVTPWITVEELAERVGASWRRTKRALVSLGALGAIQTETQKRQKRFKIIYKSPYDHSQEQDTRGQTPTRPRKADSRGDRTATEPTTELDASVEGRSPSGLYAKSSRNQARFVTQPCQKRQTSLIGDEPDWVRENDPLEIVGYISGADTELLSPEAPS
jgi:hypothetical protein